MGELERARRVGLGPNRGNSAPGRLKEHQERSVRALGEWWSRRRDRETHAGVLALPTGAGKTRTAVSFILQHVLESRRVLWLAHRDELLRGAWEAFERCESEAPRPFVVSRFDFGFKDDEPGDVVVASLPTLAKGITAQARNFRRLFDRWGGTREPLLVVVDECHHLPASTWATTLSRIRAEHPGSSVLGLSATPTRMNEAEQRKLWRMLEEVIHLESPLRLINEGVLARPSIEPYLAMGVTVKATRVDVAHWRKFGEYSPSLSRKIACQKDFNTKVRQVWREGRDRWGRLLVFAANKDHARLLAKDFASEASSSGSKLRVNYVLSGGKMSDRNAVIKTFRDGGLDVLVNVDICTEGTDLPEVETVFIARPVGSPISLQQMVGRAMRGPEMGGTRTCNIVLFAPESVDLLDSVLYGADMTVPEIRGWLGLVEETAAAQGARSRFGTSGSDTEPIEARLEEIYAALSTKRTAPPEPELPNDLLGWWEVVGDETGTFLATLREDETALRDAVERAAALRGGPAHFQVEERVRKALAFISGVRWVTPTRWNVFVRHLLESRAKYGFVPIGSALPHHWDRVRQWVAELPGAGERVSCPHCGEGVESQSDYATYRKCEKCGRSHSHAKRGAVRLVAIPSECPICKGDATKQKSYGDFFVCQSCGLSHTGAASAIGADPSPKKAVPTTPPRLDGGCPHCGSEMSRQRQMAGFVICQSCGLSHSHAQRP